MPEETDGDNPARAAESQDKPSNEGPRAPAQADSPPQRRRLSPTIPIALWGFLLPILLGAWISRNPLVGTLLGLSVLLILVAAVRHPPFSRFTTRRYKRILLLVMGFVGLSASTFLIRSSIEDYTLKREREQQVAQDIHAMRQQLDRLDAIDRLAPRFRLSLAQGGSSDAYAELAIPRDIRLAAARLETSEDRFERLGAMIALRRFKDADALISELAADPEGDEVRVNVFKGHRYYVAGDFRQASVAYRAAAGLSPDDLRIAVLFALALIYTETDHLDNLQQAIDLLDATLARASPSDDIRAEILNALAVAHLQFPIGERRARVGVAIDYLEQATRVYDASSHPREWAMLQNNFGCAWYYMPGVRKTDTMLSAIGHLQAALSQRSVESHPADWAQTQYNLGVVWTELSAGRRADSIRRGMALLEAATSIWTEEVYPLQWAQTQRALGTARMSLASVGTEAEVRARNTGMAISHYQSALRYQSEEETPRAWALTTTNLANALIERASAENNDLDVASTYLDAAHRVHRKDVLPYEWALTQSSKAALFRHRMGQDRATHVSNLRRAIELYESCHTVWTALQHPQLWARMHLNLAVVWRVLWSELPREDRDTALDAVISHTNNAATVYSAEQTPLQWGQLHYELGLAWFRHGGDDRAANLQSAVDSYEAGLLCLDRRQFPDLSANLQNAIASALISFPEPDPDRMLRAISIFESLLSIWQVDEQPIQHARILTNLAIAWGQLPSGDKRENLRFSIERALRALEILKRYAGHPSDVQRAQDTLNAAQQELDNWEHD